MVNNGSKYQMILPEAVSQVFIGILDMGIDDADVAGILLPVIPTKVSTD